MIISHYMKNEHRMCDRMIPTIVKEDALGAMKQTKL